MFYMYVVFGLVALVDETREFSAKPQFINVDRVANNAKISAL